MATTDVSKFKPGSDVSCTIAKLPRNAGAEATLERLMRLDPENKKALRRAHRMRQQRMIRYNRGNREWTSREKTARVVRLEVGRSWTMPFDASLTSDLQSVAAYLTFKAK